MILVQTIVLLEGSDRVLARGVVPIDSAEGPPRVVYWQGDTFLPTVSVDGERCYSKARPFYADGVLRAVPR